MPVTTRLHGRDALFQRAETLKRNRTKRRRAGVAFVEGVLPINAVLRGGGPVESVWFAADRPLSGWAAGVIDALGSAQRVELPGELLDELSDRDDGVELIVLAGIPDRPLDPAAAGTVAVVLDRPSGPGNIGTVVRTAAAFGASPVLIAGHAADPYDPKAIAASRGAVFEVPVIEIPGAAALAGWRRSSHAAGVPLRIVAASAEAAGSLPLSPAMVAAPVAVALGNEAGGLSHAVAELADATVHIPMPGAGVDSLNLGVAAGIVLYEASRRLT